MATSTSSALLPITHSVEGVAEVLISSSFAIFQVDDECSNAIQHASEDANKFLASNDDKLQYQLVMDGKLLGFNEPPTASKYLYRAFLKCPNQPWPSADFKGSAERVADLLHHILLQCLQTLELRLCNTAQDQTPAALELFHKRNCPLDFFFYHNQNSSVENCTDHVDRGYLICVCLTPVPGLEVWSANHGEFLCPEELLKSPNCSSNLICVMVGDELRRKYPLQLKACVHRVRAPLQSPRLSISYEIRLQ